METVDSGRANQSLAQSPKSRLTVSIQPQHPAEAPDQGLSQANNDQGGWVQLLTNAGTSGLFLGVSVREEGAGMRCSKTIQAGQCLDSSKGPVGLSPPPVPTAGFSSFFCVCHVNLLPGVLVSSVTSQYSHLSMALCQLAAHDWPRLSCVCV
ncbi:uncharacterized protein [Symphalangus syndactylus]|uniref:uncharacterized protein n=1 Tax=Symphalangus syndactylus TaxID=9590 RepID=UPI0030049EEB